MKILIVIDSLGSGGAERSTYVLCKYLRQRNIFFQVFCLDKKDVGVQNAMLEAGYPIIFLEKGNFIFQVRTLASYIKKNKFDIVHSILFRSNLRTRFAKIFTNFLHVESLVNTTYSQERFSDKKVNQTALKIYKHLDKITARSQVNHFHSITETVKNHYISELGLNEEKITVIYRGRSPIIKSYEEKPKTFGDKFHLINVGRHEFQKGQIYLLQAIKILKEEGWNIKLTILGRDGSSTSELKKYILGNNLNEIIKLEGFKHNVSEFLLESDIFLFPSLYEGLGGALIEAQAAGLPVACNNIPVLHEVVNEDVNAKFFNVHDINSIADSIRFFLDNPEKIKEYGQQSLLNFNSKFLEKNNNERIIKLYQSLLNK